MAKRRNPGTKKGSDKVRVDFRRNRARPARDRSWTRQYQEHGFEETDTERMEHVAAKGDLSRKRTVSLSEELAGLPEGRVVAMRGLIADVDLDDAVWPCAVRRVLRTRLIRERHPVTVGDRVRVSPAHRRRGVRSAGQEPGVEIVGVIEWVAPRRGCLTRRYANRTQVIVANVDQAVIVTSTAQPYCKPQLIDRYLISAHAGEIAPVICFNKIDLDPERRIEPIRKRYVDLEYQTLATSALTGEGVDRLREVLRDKASVIVGQSGVGKSSLLNAIQPDLRLRVRDVSTETEKGMHTTSTAELLRLNMGGYVVDTPGIRSFELADVGRHELEMYYVDIARYVPDCKFPDCTHTHEEGCAVKQAVADGRIHPERYESYLHLYEGE
jgi:ribosome biogenesis GTPase